jgi:hypothetical protein
MLAYEVNGVPLPPQHGAPLRLIVPDWYGMASVKWLRSITAIAEPFDGFHQGNQYRYKRSADEKGEPVTRQRPRAMMAPPGIPSQLGRTRYVEAGRVRIEGRAWSGFGAVERVEFSPDAGKRPSWEGGSGGSDGSAGPTSGRPASPASTRSPAGPPMPPATPNPSTPKRSGTTAPTGSTPSSASPSSSGRGGNTSGKTDQRPPECSEKTTLRKRSATGG